MMLWTEFSREPPVSTLLQPAVVASTGVSMYLTKEAICVHIAAGADRAYYKN